MQLPGVVVQVMGTNPPLAVITGESGEFRINNVPLGRWQLMFKVIGYKESYATVVLNSGKEAVINVALEKSVIQGEEVVITSQQDKTETNNKMSTVSARVFSAEEAARYAGSR